MSRGRWALAVGLVAVLVVSAGALARELLPLRSILGLTDDGPCVPSLASVRFPGNAASNAGHWQQAGLYPTARDEVRATTVAGDVHVGTGVVVEGGTLGSLDEMFRFDPGRRAYDELPPVPTRVDHAAFAGDDDALYVIGGYVDEVPTDAVWKYSPANAPLGSPVSARHRAWSRRGGHRRREDLRGRRIVGKAGNDRASARRPRDLRRRERRVDERPGMPTARHHHGAAAVDGVVVVVGGRADGDLSVDVTERFDPATQTWTSLAPLPLGAGGLAVVAVGDDVVAIGGGDDDEAWVTPAAWRLDIAANEWSRLADLNVARHGLGAASVGRDVYVFGGAPCPGYGRTEVVESLSVPDAGASN